MASVFLSYAREDAASAKALAKCLERAGHSVWWDRHIHGGSEYSGEIEAALRDADVVLVLWSDTSLRSAWVRDEAAEGRDSGRLVPVLLDGAKPPLGFRQLQSISIAGWSGRGSPPNFNDLQAAIGKRAGSAAPAAAGEPAAPMPRTRRRFALAGLAVIAALLVGMLAWWAIDGRRPASAQAPVLAVLPFADLSPTRDKAYFTEGVSEAILTTLARDPGIKVLGRTTAEQIHNAGAGGEKMRRALGVTHVLEGSARSIGNQLRMSVRLIDASDGQQIWAEEYARTLDNVFAVQDEIGRAVAQRLKGSIVSAGAAQPPTSADVYTLYLAARAKIRDRRLSSLNEALALVRRAVSADPDYAPAHALYAELVRHLAADGYGNIPAEQSKRIALQHARRAIQLAPNSPEGYAALGLSLESAAAIEPLQKAVRLDPARAEVRHWLGHALNALGRQEEALRNFEAALDMEPLWGPATMMVAYTLAASERYRDAERVVANFERRGGSRALANKIRGDIANYRGDYSEAVRLSELALAQDPEAPQAEASASFFYYLLGMPDRAGRFAKRQPPYSRLLFTGRDQQLLQQVRSDGAPVWNQADPQSAFEALSKARDFDTIVALYDSRPKDRPSLCDDAQSVQMSIGFAAALKAQGRGAESAALLGCVKKVLVRHGRGPIRAAYLPASVLDLQWAQVRALEGESDQAFALLGRSIDHGMRMPYGRGLAALEAFDALKSHPAYARLDLRLKRLIAADRAEAMRQG